MIKIFNICSLAKIIDKKIKKGVFMKIITVLMGDVYGFPPVLSLLHAFEKLDVECVFITTNSRKDLKKEFSKIKVEQLNVDYESIEQPMLKFLHLFEWRKDIWKLIDKHYSNNSMIWVVTDVTVKVLGKELMNRKYVLHLLELSERITYYSKLKFLEIDKYNLGNNATAIVVPEYNRAHIIKTWWKLKKLPYILPNKPYIFGDIEKNSMIEDQKAKEIIDQIGDKKIILYQGIIDPERPLDAFIEAVDEYKGEYAFVVMSGGKNIYENCKSDNYYFIPFVTPPKHLQVTSHAYIGVLSYVPTDSSGYSPLNALYCAPNKTFEYSKFGIPMLGNDTPGLKFLFETKKCGVCFNEFNKKEICAAIDEIESTYPTLSKNSLEYYNSCDYVKIIKNILRNL